MDQFAQHHFITTHRLMSSRPFAQGFNDVRNKKSFKYDKYTSPAEAYAYERGRQFAMHYIGPLKIGKVLTISAEAAMNRLMRAGLVI